MHGTRLKILQAEWFQQLQNWEKIFTMQLQIYLEEGELRSGKLQQQAQKKYLKRELTTLKPRLLKRRKRLLKY